jgi:putative membrane protein
MPAQAGVAAVVVVGFWLLLGHELKPFSAHMVWHIATMNVMGPLAATALVCRLRAATPVQFGMVTAAQVSALWFWHVPAVQNAVVHQPAGAVVMHVSLFVLATLFWTGVLQLRGGNRWHAILALIVTAKLSCLLAVLLIFSPRLLYGVHHSVDAAALTDQQLAGLLMVTACPLSYLAAAVILAIEMAGLTTAKQNARAV